MAVAFPGKGDAEPDEILDQAIGVVASLSPRLDASHIEQDGDINGSDEEVFSYQMTSCNVRREKLAVASMLDDACSLGSDMGYDHLDSFDPHNSGVEDDSEGQSAAQLRRVQELLEAAELREAVKHGEDAEEEEEADEIRRSMRMDDLAQRHATLLDLEEQGESDGKTWAAASARESHPEDGGVDPLRLPVDAELRSRFVDEPIECIDSDEEPGGCNESTLLAVEGSVDADILVPETRGQQEEEASVAAELQELGEASAEQQEASRMEEFQEIGEAPVSRLEAKVVQELREFSEACVEDVDAICSQEIGVEVSELETVIAAAAEGAAAGVVAEESECGGGEGGAEGAVGESMVAASQADEEALRAEYLVLLERAGEQRRALDKTLAEIKQLEVVLGLAQETGVTDADVELDKTIAEIKHLEATLGLDVDSAGDELEPNLGVGTLEIASHAEAHEEGVRMDSAVPGEKARDIVIQDGLTTTEALLPPKNAEEPEAKRARLERDGVDEHT